MKTPKLLFALILSALISGCGASAIVTTPIENIDNSPLKADELTLEEKRSWGHLDLIQDTIPGMSVNKAYKEIIKGRKGKTTIVAVIDSGIDIGHEDLDGNIWINKDEVPNNGKDDDNNGYVDDVHGWNFLGDTYNEQLEYVRLIASGDKSNPRYNEAVMDQQQEMQKYTGLKNQYDRLDSNIKVVDPAISTHLNKDNYTKKDLNEIKTEDETLASYVSYMKQLLSGDFEGSKDLKETIKNDMDRIYDFLNYHLNISFNGRKTGDDPNDFSQRNYGNYKVAPSKKSEKHGTHVAGIIAAERNNGKGMNGVANNAKIMSLRTVPNGDEYDKDVALAIRYAADNGAKVINMSFGKYYSPHSDWVRDAILYAASKDVLLVAGAGNEHLDLDKKNNFPNDSMNNEPEIADNYLSIGALDYKYGSTMVADYSNYGKNNVDLFAPGSHIYSTTPENEYESIQGTSMAAPGVAGIAALIRSQYPGLSASQVKHVLINSGVATTTKVLVGGDAGNVMPFDKLSKSSKIANAYNALIMAKALAEK